MKNFADQIRSVGLVGNSDKASGAKLIHTAARLVTAAGRKVCSDPVTAEFAGLKAEPCKDPSMLCREVDLLLVFGGDGTMLRVARAIAGSRTPILGINTGSLGFLTAVPPDGLAQALKQIWRGDFRFESRSLLEAEAKSGRTRFKQAALNDIVISRGVASRLIELDVRVDGEPLTFYRCDGLIFSSPTGSTAYSLAAGGAVIYPTANVFSLTPICPHTLSNRSLILPLSSKVEVRVVSTTTSTMLSADGQVIHELAAGNVVSIKRSRRTVRLVHLADASFCETLRHKLHWRGTTLEQWSD